MIDLTLLLTNKNFLTAIVVIVIGLLLSNSGLLRRITDITVDLTKGEFKASVKAEKPELEKREDEETADNPDPDEKVDPN